jgi:hypothetical protein
MANLIHGAEEKAIKIFGCKHKRHKSKKFKSL